MLTDRGFANTVLAQQMYGGHGYIVETGMEQFVSDCRITMMYEGANGVQALDLVARKLPRDGGRAIRAFVAEMRSFVAECSATSELQSFIDAFEVGLSNLEKATAIIFEQSAVNVRNAVAGSTDYMHLLGLVALGYMWLRMIHAAREKIAKGNTTPHLESKLITGRFYMSHILVESALHLVRITAGGESVLAMPADAF